MTMLVVAFHNFSKAPKNEKGSNTLSMVLRHKLNAFVPNLRTTHTCLNNGSNVLLVLTSCSDKCRLFFSFRQKISCGVVSVGMRR